MDTVDSQFEDGDPTFFGHRKGHGTDKNHQMENGRSM